MSSHNARAAEITRTKNTVGWAFILDAAEEIVKEMQFDADSCDDADRRFIVLARRAQAARLFLVKFKLRLENLSQPEQI